MSNYKILTCASYGASGSGIVTDYLQEFDNIFNPGDYEFRFLQDFGGITTLEDCLVHSHHRLNSDTAILLFKKYIKYQNGDFVNKRYNRVFKGEFERITNDFLDGIIDAKWHGHWEEDQVLASKIVDILYYKIWTRIKRFFDRSRKGFAYYYPCRDMYFANPTEEEFYNAVKQYLNQLFNIIDPKHQYEYLYFDQLLPPVNQNRYFNYFDDLHLIVVDRDPRDYYLENVKRYGDRYLPHDVDTFIKVFKGLRRKLNEEEDNKNVLRVRMEDTIYDYESFSKKIDEFVGLSPIHHTKPKSRFNPAISIKNTQLWKKRKVDMDIIHRIEDELSNYCYDFDQFK